MRRLCLSWCCYKWQIVKSQRFRTKSLFSSCEIFQRWVFTRQPFCNCPCALIQDPILSNLHLSCLQYTNFKIILLFISSPTNPWVKENEESSIVRTCPQFHALALGMCLKARNLTNTVKPKEGGGRVGRKYGGSTNILWPKKGIIATSRKS